MKIKLEGKSAQYLSLLRKCIDKYGETAPEKLKLFLKYADANTGVVRNKEGILRILAPDINKVLIVIEPCSLKTFMVVNAGANEAPGIGNHLDFEVIRKTFGRVGVGIDAFSTQKAQVVVDRVHALLWIKRRPWHNSLTRLQWLNLAVRQVCLQELDAGLGMGYSFDKLTACQS